jgi:hypothetical protein
MVLVDASNENINYRTKNPMKKCIRTYLDDQWELSQRIDEYRGLM